MYLRLIIISLLLIASLSCRNDKSITTTTWEEKDEREAWQRPQEVIDLLGELGGLTVADIGAGTGFFSFRLLMRGANVIASDIDQDMLDIINKIKHTLPDSLQTKLSTRLASVDNPKIEPNEADIMLIINTIGYIKNKENYLVNLYNTLPLNGKIMIIDYKSKDSLPEGAPDSIFKVKKDEIYSVLKKAGFEKLRVNESLLKYQYVATAEKL